MNDPEHAGGRNGLCDHDRCMDAARAIDRLYESDPASFTKERDAIAKSLKAEGDNAAAKEVKAKKKPTQVAWVLNQLARRYPDDVARLVDVGRELAREHRKALRGESPKSTAFRESIERQREAIKDVTKRAKELMTDLGVGQTHLDEVSAALQAALIDPQIGAQLEEGRLEKAPEPAAGFAGPLLADIGPAESKDIADRRKAHERETKKAEKAAAKVAAADRKREAGEKKKAGGADAAEKKKQQAAEAKREAAEAKKRAAAEAKEAAKSKAEIAEARAAVKAAEADLRRRATAAEKAEERAKQLIDEAKELAEAAKTAAANLEAAKKAFTRAQARA